MSLVQSSQEKEALKDGRHSAEAQGDKMADNSKPAIPRSRLRWHAPVGFCDLALVVLATCPSVAISFTIPRPAHRSWPHRTSRQRSATTIMGARSTLVVVGGGAAGYFGAIQAAANTESGSLKVVVLEAGRLPLSKVKISGGGRCNVMHDIAKVHKIQDTMDCKWLKR